MNVINRVLLEKKVKQDMDLMPSFIQNKFRGWVQFVELSENKIEIIIVIEVQKHDY